MSQYLRSFITTPGLFQRTDVREEFRALVKSVHQLLHIIHKQRIRKPHLASTQDVLHHPDRSLVSQKRRAVFRRKRIFECLEQRSEQANNLCISLRFNSCTHYCPPRLRPQASLYHRQHPLLPRSPLRRRESGFEGTSPSLTHLCKN